MHDLTTRGNAAYDWITTDSKALSLKSSRDKGFITMFIIFGILWYCDILGWVDSL